VRIGKGGLTSPLNYLAGAPEESPNPKAGPLLWADLSYLDAVHQFEREFILARLEHYGGSVKATRESSGLSKATFHRYMKALITGPTPDASQE